MTNDKTPTNATIDALYDRSVVDQSGNKIGEIGQVYLCLLYTSDAADE